MRGGTADRVRGQQGKSVRGWQNNSNLERNRTVVHLFDSNRTEAAVWEKCLYSSISYNGSPPITVTKFKGQDFEKYC